MMIPPGSTLENEAKLGRLMMLDHSGVEVACRDLGEYAAVQIPDERHFCTPQVPPP